MTTYKLMIMGASGVGKTVFLTSYFYSALKKPLGLGRGDFTVTMSEQRRDGADKTPREEIEELIGLLMRSHIAPGGTDRTMNLTFDVKGKDTHGKELEACFELHDLPGGDTTDTERWSAYLGEWLKDADGVIFFIPAPGLTNEKYLVTELDLAPFNTALGKLRKSRHAKKERADIPVWFIYTQGDRVPGVTKKKLDENNRGLIKTARGGGGLFKLFKKGGHVRSFKVSALGEWNGAQPPEMYSPDGVVESMESLFREVAASQAEHKRRRWIWASAVAVLAYSGLVFSVWTSEKALWTKTHLTAQTAVERRDFTRARSELESYASRSPRSFLLLPPFLPKVGVEASALLTKVAAQEESLAYARLNNLFKSVDFMAMPEGEAVYFTKMYELADAYTSVKRFETIQPEHYAQVVKLKAYFAAGAALNERFDKDKEAFAVFVGRKLAHIKASSAWRDEAVQRLADEARRWTTERLGTLVSLDDAERFETELAELFDRNDLPAPLTSILAEARITAGIRAASMWRDRFDEWFMHARRLNAQESVTFWEKTLSEQRIPAGSKQQLDEQLASAYLTVAEELSKNAQSVDQLKADAARWPRMTEAGKKIIVAKMSAMIQAEFAEHRGAVDRASNFAQLNVAVRNAVLFIKRYQNFDGELTKIVERKINELASQLQQKGTAEVKRLINGHNYGAAKAAVESNAQLNEMKNLPALEELEIFTKRRSETAAQCWQLRDEVQSSHYIQCVSLFRDLRRSYSNAGASRVDTLLQEYARLWPDSGHAKEVSNVQEYLRAVRNGIRCSVTVKDGRFFGTSESQPDMYVIVYHNDTHIGTTRVVDDTKYPTWNESFHFTWRHGDIIKFYAYDENVFSDDHILGQRVWIIGLPEPTIKADVSERNNWINIEFKFIGLPSCPW